MSRIFLGNVSRDTTVEDVEEFFSAYPKPHEVILKDGFAFVELTDPADAADAVRDLHQKPIRGQAIAVELARTRAANGSGARGGGGGGSGGGGGGSGSGYRLIIDRLPNCSWQELKDLFRPFGRINFADVDRAHREGFVEFQYPEDAERAERRMDRTNFMGEKIGVRAARRRHSRSRSRDRYRSRSRSPRRDRHRGSDRDGRRGGERREERRSRSRDRRGSGHRDEVVDDRRGRDGGERRVRDEERRPRDDDRRRPRDEHSDDPMEMDERRGRAPEREDRHEDVRKMSDSRSRSR